MDWEESRSTWHVVPFPEHAADVLRERDWTCETWTWESQRVHLDGMTWDTMSCIWFPDQPTGPYYTKDGYDQWRWVDPRHPRCWTCGRFFRREKWHKGRLMGPCDQCDEGDYW